MMELTARVDGENGQARILEVAGETIRLGRAPNCEVMVDGAVFPKVSGIHARIEPAPGGFALVHVSQRNKTLLNEVPLASTARLRDGDRIRLGFTGPTITVLAMTASDPTRPEPLNQSAETLRADARDLALLRGSARTCRLEIGSGGVIGREQGAVAFLLDHPHVSRRHASLSVSGQQVVLADLGSANGTFVNGKRLALPTLLHVGDRIDIGPFSLQFDGAGLVSRSRSDNVELVCDSLSRLVKDRATGLPLTLLSDIDLVIRPREFVCLLGPSGSGKSTLLAILSGRSKPDGGIVRLNGEDFHENFEALKEDTAVVPQKDVLHDSLSVGAVLRYTAELRLPPDLSVDEVNASVTDILEVVGLTQRRETLIRHLSGGQVKRASLANELVSRPSLLFLDEVTSGLDEQTDREVMELFRQVADGGKTVVCITHSLANVEGNCHLVVILSAGGRLAFVGTSDEARGYFGISRLGDVYQKLGTRSPEEWDARFRASPLYRRYVAQRMPAEPRGRKTVPATAPRSLHPGMSGLRQAWVLTRRYVSIWRGDRMAVLAMLGQSLMVAVLLGLFFGDLSALATPADRVSKTLNLLMLLAVSSFWFGCNTAAKELVKERVIYRRERDHNLRIVTYIASKCLVLTVMVVVQVSLLFAIDRFWCKPAGAISLQWLTLALVAMAGTAVGLSISALARSEEVATALVPTSVIPQIVLAGVIAPLNGLAKFLAKGFITVHWAVESLERLLPEADLAVLERESESWVGPLSILLAHVAFGALATMVFLWWDDRKVRRR